jgi:hypothetical protein
LLDRASQRASRIQPLRDHHPDHHSRRVNPGSLVHPQISLQQAEQLTGRYLRIQVQQNGQFRGDHIKT